MKRADLGFLLVWIGLGLISCGIIALLIDFM